MSLKQTSRSTGSEHTVYLLYSNTNLQETMKTKMQQLLNSSTLWSSESKSRPVYKWKSYTPKETNEETTKQRSETTRTPIVSNEDTTPNTCLVQRVQSSVQLSTECPVNNQGRTIMSPMFQVNESTDTTIQQR